MKLESIKKTLLAINYSFSSNDIKKIEKFIQVNEFEDWSFDQLQTFKMFDVKEMQGRGHGAQSSGYFVFETEKEFTSGDVLALKHYVKTIFEKGLNSLPNLRKKFNYYE